MSVGVTVLLAVVVVVMATKDSTETGMKPLPALAAEDLTFVSPVTGKPIEIVVVEEQSVYTGGPVAYVDFSVDSFGECVVVWYPDSRFANCADATEGWQTMFQFSVPAGTDYAKISREWDDVFAPSIWR